MKNLYDRIDDALRPDGFLLGLLLLAVGVLGVSAVLAVQQTPAVIQSPEAESGDQFGRWLDLDGSTLAIGSHAKDGARGAVYVFDHDGTSWTFVQKLVAPDRQPNDQFGSAVSVSGDRIAVGAFTDDFGGLDNAGSVYVFERQTDGTFAAIANLQSPDALDHDWAGHNVRIDGERVATSIFSAWLLPDDEQRPGRVEVSEIPIQEAPPAEEVDLLASRLLATARHTSEQRALERSAAHLDSIGDTEGGDALRALAASQESLASDAAQAAALQILEAALAPQTSQLKFFIGPPEPTPAQGVEER